MEADDLQAQELGLDADADRLIADRLDALEAERVLQRALELEAESLAEPHEITPEQLHRIAKEIGVDSAFVSQALGEIKLEPTPRSRFARWVVPDNLFETATVQGVQRDNLDAAIAKWMTQHEGLTAGGILEDGIDWDVDRRWRARVLSRSISGGNRISRVASGDVRHRLHSIGEQEHLIALESLGRLPLLFARVVMSIGGTLGLLALIGAATTDGVLIGLAIAAALIGPAIALAVSGARWWARGIRGALRRSLLGLVDAATKSRKPRFRLRRKPKP